MPQIIREVSIDVSKSNIFQAIVAKQNDSNSRFLKATITDNGKKITVESSSIVTINGTRPDEDAKAFEGSVNEDGTVTVPLTNWLLELDGRVKCEISVVDAEGRKLTTMKFMLLVEAAAYDGSDISEDEDADLLISILAECAGAKEAVGQVINSVEENRKNILEMSKITAPIAENIESVEKETSVTVEGVLNTNTNETHPNVLVQVVDGVPAYKNTNWGRSKTFSGIAGYDFVSVATTGNGTENGAKYPPIVFFDVNGNYISSPCEWVDASGNKTVEIDRLEIPENADYFVVNAHGSTLLLSDATLYKIGYERKLIIKEDHLDDELKTIVEDVKTARIDETNPLDKISETGGFMRCFDKIACIGDSLTAGVLNYTYPETGEISRRGMTSLEVFSYPAQLAKMTGCAVYNFGQSGTTATNSDEAAARAWLTIADKEAHLWLSEDNKASAYIIALGVNDIGYYGTFDGNVSTDIDTDNYVNNAKNSVGGYATIIQRILEMQPKAKIFCVCVPNTRHGATARAEANTKIKAIANMFGCYVIDLETYGVQPDDVSEWKAKYCNGGHLNALGYNQLAKMYLSYMNWIIEQNIEDFSNVAFIGTEYLYEK